MKDILTASFMRSAISTIREMYAHGWDERNGGNLSLRLDEAQVRDYLDPESAQGSFLTGFEAPSLDGQIFLVTGAGRYFRNVDSDPAANLALVRLDDGGRRARLLWGLREGGSVTSEFAAHMMTHAVRLEADGEHRVVMHCHPTNLLAMTFVHELDEREFTRTLWRMCSECIMVFPDGVNVLPWMLCGTNEIGRATAEKMRTARLVVWGQHGLYAAGRDLDEAFGLVETAEKAAEVYLKIAHLPRLNTITDGQLRQIADHVGVTPRAGWLEG